MEKYNYRKALENDIKCYLEQEYTEEALQAELQADFEEIFDKLYGDLWSYDGVTGNGSGSYFFSHWEAEEALCHNFDIVSDMLAEFGLSTSGLCDAEGVDVAVRCFLLYDVLRSVLESLLRSL